MNVHLQLKQYIVNGRRAHDLNLQAADLTDMDLSGLNADRLDLRRADLRGAKLLNVRLGDCRLQNAQLQGSDWTDTTLRMCSLDGAQAMRACFDGATLEDSTATGAELSQASLRGAHLTETSFARAVLREANLNDAEGEGVGFRGADLVSATLIGARLAEADFRGADLTNADLTGGSFRSADFRGAILDGARFDGADCGGAYFDDGHAPDAPTTAEPQSNEDSAFDQAVGATLLKLVSELPVVFAARQGPAAEILDRVQRDAATHAPAPDISPEALQEWLQQLMNSGNGQSQPDLNALFQNLRQAPNGPLPMHDGSMIVELLSRLQQTLGTLEHAGDQPSEEWKPWLEPLMQKINAGEQLDADSLLDLLSAFTHHQPSTSDEQGVGKSQ